MTVSRLSGSADFETDTAHLMSDGDGVGGAKSYDYSSCTWGDTVFGDGRGNGEAASNLAHYRTCFTESVRPEKRR